MINQLNNYALKLVSIHVSDKICYSLIDNPRARGKHQTTPPEYHYGPALVSRHVPTCTCTYLSYQALPHTCTGLHVCKYPHSQPPRGAPDEL